MIEPIKNMVPGKKISEMFSALARFALLICLSAPYASVYSEEGVYLLGPGDLVRIRVYDEPDLSIDEIRIGMAGSLSFPLLGDVPVVGQTPEKLEAYLVDRLKGPFLVSPSVTVSILEYRPFYINGEVRKPGSYSFYPGMTIDRAISVAGGFTDRASREKIFVEHDLSENRDPEGNSEKRATLSDHVLPGDVITVRQGFF